MIITTCLQSVPLSAQVVNTTLIGNLHIELTFSHMVPAAVVGLEPIALGG
jgi:hypothetical protein